MVLFFRLRNLAAISKSSTAGRDDSNIEEFFCTKFFASASRFNPRVSHHEKSQFNSLELELFLFISS
jgi:hypothetical protein